jgi:AraC-like DNA-binding protein
MLKHSDTLSFSDHSEFYDATAETDRIIGAYGERIFRCESPFASIESETYCLFGMVDLIFFKISPLTDIDIHYEFNFDFFHMGYVEEGIQHLLTESRCCDTACSTRLYMAPPSGSRGRVIYYKEHLVRTLSFYGLRPTREIINEILGESSAELWIEATGEKGRGGENSYPFVSAPPRVSYQFQRIANCDYPNRVKCLFFENAIREILLEFVVYKLPEKEALDIMGEFETEQIKSVPGILMERFDSPPSIAELARELSMSATKLKLGFKRIFGKPIYASHRDACLERAAAMLLDTNMHAYEIAAKVGYSGNGNFANAFKKHYGVSPIQYRRNGREY